MAVTTEYICERKYSFARNLRIPDKETTYSYNFVAENPENPREKTKEKVVLDAVSIHY